MRHIQHGDAEPALEVENLAPHIGAQLRIEVRQRLVHQTHRRLRHDRTPERHALLLPARKLPRPARQQMPDPQYFHRAIQPPLPLRLRHAARPQPEYDVLGNVQMRKQRVGLEHHGHPALRRRQRRHVPPADLHRPRTGLLQPRDDAQTRRLAAAGGAEQHTKTPRRDMQRHPVKRRHRPPAPGHIGQAHIRAGAPLGGCVGNAHLLSP